MAEKRSGSHHHHLKCHLLTFPWGFGGVGLVLVTHLRWVYNLLALGRILTLPLYEKARFQSSGGPPQPLVVPVCVKGFLLHVATSLALQHGTAEQEDRLRNVQAL